jgi:uncharacterized protein YbjT (DUF2867 family)
MTDTRARHSPDLAAPGRSVLLCGATGVVGSECLRLLSVDPAFGRVVTIGRRPVPPAQQASAHMSRIEQHVVDFDNLAAHAGVFAVDAIICALGTTMRRAGSKERFREVDLGYPLAVARTGVEQGASHFVLVSSIGAAAGSRAFYTRVKGELEDAVSSLPYRSITIVRPSLLLGERREFRLGEAIGKRFAALMPRRFRPVEASAVAAVLIQAAKDDVPGHRVIESQQIPAARSTQ